MEAEEKARDENLLAESMGKISVSREDEQTRAVHIFRNCFVARLREGYEGVQVCSGKVGLLEYLDELLPER